jgi:hypothetical protein
VNQVVKNQPVKSKKSVRYYSPKVQSKPVKKLTYFHFNKTKSITMIVMVAVVVLALILLFSLGGTKFAGKAIGYGISEVTIPANSAGIPASGSIFVGDKATLPVFANLGDRDGYTFEFVVNLKNGVSIDKILPAKGIHILSIDKNKVVGAIIRSDQNGLKTLKSLENQGLVHLVEIVVTGNKVEPNSGMGFSEFIIYDADRPADIKYNIIRNTVPALFAVEENILSGNIAEGGYCNSDEDCQVDLNCGSISGDQKLCCPANKCSFMPEDDFCAVTGKVYDDDYYGIGIGNKVCVNGQWLDDTDKDAVDDLIDNCPLNDNFDQLDSDNDGEGDICDVDYEVPADNVEGCLSDEECTDNEYCNEGKCVDLCIDPDETIITGDDYKTKTVVTSKEHPNGVEDYCNTFSDGSVKLMESICLNNEYAMNQVDCALEFDDHVCYNGICMVDVSPVTVIEKFPIEEGVIESGIVLNVEEVLLGDVNGDGVLDVLDILPMINHIIGKEILPQEKIFIADVCSDNKINVLDILPIISSIINENQKVDTSKCS